MATFALEITLFFLSHLTFFEAFDNPRLLVITHWLVLFLNIIYVSLSLFDAQNIIDHF